MGNPKSFYAEGAIFKPGLPPGPGKGPEGASYRFDTRNYPKEEQFDRFRAEMARFATADRLPGSGETAGFISVREGWHLNGLQIVRASTDAQAFARTPRDIASSGLDGWALFLHESGWGVNEVNEQVRTLKPGLLELRQLNVPNRGFATYNDHIAVFLRRDLFPGCEGLLDGIATHSWPQPFHPLLGSFVRMSLTYVGSVAEREKENLKASIVSMIKACLTLSRDDLALADKQMKAARLEVARRFIDANLTRPDLTPEKVRAALAVSRRHLYDLFEPYGGIAAYIRRRRLAAAHAAISAPEEKRLIGEIAHALGMTDQGQFSRLFSAEFGYNPREAREMAMFGEQSGSLVRWLQAKGDHESRPGPSPAGRISGQAGGDREAGGGRPGSDATPGTQ